MMIELKENIPHGTKEYPYDQYFIHNVRHPFQFPVHWHDELEIIYIRQGTLHVSIEGQDYLGHSGSIFMVNPRELHFMGSDDLSAAYYTLLFPLEFISFQTMDGLEWQRTTCCLPRLFPAVKLIYKEKCLPIFRSISLKSSL